MTHPFSDFSKFIETDFESYILPIIPAGAPLASKLSPDSVGKVPGRWLAEQRAWVGFKGWSKHYIYARASSLKHWQQ